MVMNASLVSRAYQAAISSIRPGEGAARGPGAGETAAGAAKSFIETLRQAEEVSQAGLVGRADPQSVVSALASAEVALQSAIAIRDKVVESYQEILRMPV
ncbi:MAG: flagellar hook-basal body complex protein FliE [Pikeienuella sp.]